MQEGAQFTDLCSISNTFPGSHECVLYYIAGKLFVVHAKNRRAIQLIRIVVVRFKKCLFHNTAVVFPSLMMTGDRPNSYILGGKSQGGGEGLAALPAPQRVLHFSKAEYR